MTGAPRNRAPDRNVLARTQTRQQRAQTSQHTAKHYSRVHPAANLSRNTTIERCPESKAVADSRMVARRVPAQEPLYSRAHARGESKGSWDMERAQPLLGRDHFSEFFRGKCLLKRSGAQRDE